LNATFERFLSEVEADARIADLADDMRAGLEHIWADPDLSDACTWVLRQPGHTIVERIDAVSKLLTALEAELRSPRQYGELIRLNLRELVGW
jgi:hypothetical protein